MLIGVRAAVGGVGWVGGAAEGRCLGCLHSFFKMLGRLKRTKAENKNLGCCLDETDASGHRRELIGAVLKGNSSYFRGIYGTVWVRRASVCIRMGPTGIRMHPYGSDGHPYASVSVRWASIWIHI